MRTNLAIGLLGAMNLFLGMPASADDFGSHSSDLAAISSTGECDQQRPPNPLTLFYVIERTLCLNPKTRAAWASVHAAAAAVSASKTAYLPSVNAQLRFGYEHHDTDVSESPDLTSHFGKAINEESLGLTWVLYDFGARASTVRDSQQLLLAAQANRDAALQGVFAKAADDFYKAQATAAVLAVRQQLESAATEVLAVAHARVDKGVSPITDELQAGTAASQAVYERGKAEGDVKLVLGLLAVDMSLSPDETLSLPELIPNVSPGDIFMQAVHDLLLNAQRDHPKVLAAAAQWQASVEGIRFARSQGLPVVRVTGQSDRNNTPVSASLGQPELPAVSRDHYIGLRVDIPLMDGFRRKYEIQQAEAAADQQAQILNETKQSISIDVWSSVQTLQNTTQNLRNTEAVRANARRAYEAAYQRYQSGVGSIVDLLNAQSSIASADHQQIAAQLEWRVARTQLAASLGNLGMWAIQR